MLVRLRAAVLCCSLLAALGPRPAVAFCPSKCNCDEANGGRRIECIGSALDVVPIQLNPEAQSINLTHNHIQNVHFTLQFYTGLQALDLSHNHIGNLGARNFEAQAKLERLLLSANRIGHLSRDAFKGLHRLRVLRLNDNRLASIHALAMHDLRALERLDLAGNALVSLDDGTLRNCANVRELIMRQNELLDVPSENLRYAGQSLRSLDLAQNYIQQLANDSFPAALGQLHALDLSANVINELDVLSLAALGQLQRLTMDDNNITIMPTAQLSQLANLTFLSLSANPIAALPALSFGNLFQLRELHIDRMEQLAHIDPRAFVDNMQLQTLSMNGNGAVRSLPAALFANNPHLVEIQMRANNLTGLAAETLPLGQLRRIAIGHNPLVCNCSLLWLWQLAQPPGSPSIAPASGAQAAQPPSSPSLVDGDNVTCEARESGTQRVLLLRRRSVDTMRCERFGVLAAVGVLLAVVVAGAAMAAVVVARLRQRRPCRHTAASAHMVPGAGGLAVHAGGGSARPNSKLFNESLQRCAAGAADEYDDDEYGDDEDEDNHYEEFDDYRYGGQHHHHHHRQQQPFAQPTMYGAPPANVVYV